LSDFPDMTFLMFPLAVAIFQNPDTPATNPKRRKVKTEASVFAFPDKKKRRAEAKADAIKASCRCQ
jgi:hypothetical protein